MRKIIATLLLLLCLPALATVAIIAGVFISKGEFQMFELKLFLCSITMIIITAATAIELNKH